MLTVSLAPAQFTARVWGVPPATRTIGGDAVSVPPTVLGPQSLGEALRMLRHRARTSRDQLASAAGVSAGAISNYENDNSVPPAPTLRKVCRVLAASLDWPPADLWAQMGLLIDQFDTQEREEPG